MPLNSILLSKTECLSVSQFKTMGENRLFEYSDCFGFSLAGSVVFLLEPYELDKLIHFNLL